VGVGFAIPSNMAQKIYSGLVKDGKVTRGWLGVQIQELEPALAGHFGLAAGAKGVVVADVMPEGPALAAGLREGDVVTEFNGQKVESVRALQRVVAESKVGSPVPLKVWRDKGWKSLKITIGDMASFDGEDAPGAAGRGGSRLGLSVRALEASEASERKLRGGVVVQAIEPGSAAEEAGLQQGDVIIEMDKARVTSPAEFSRLAKKIPAGGTAILRVNRSGRNLYLSLQMPEAK
jgi:serine protease Do